jgi:hypothetical protein
MTWFKVDDRLHSSRKILSIPRSVRLSSVGLWTLAGSWSAHEELDGLVPDYMVTELGGTPRLVAALVTAGLWIEVVDGSQFNKWQEYQPTRAELELARTKETERKRLYRARGTQTGVPTGQTEGHQQESEHPDPTPPDPTSSSTDVEEETLSAKASKRGTRLPEPFIVNGDMRSWAAGEVPAVDVDAATRSFVDYWRGRAGSGATKVDWVATWRNSLRSAAARSGQHGVKQSKADRASGVVDLARRLQEEDDRKAISA